MKKCETMTALRAEIDALDRKIVPLLVARLAYIEQASRIKKHREHIRDDARVDDVLAKVKALSGGAKSDARMVEAVYRYIMEWSITHELALFDTDDESA